MTERRGEERGGREQEEEEKDYTHMQAQIHRHTSTSTHTHAVAYMTRRWMCNCSVFNPAMCLLSRHIRITVPSKHTHKLCFSPLACLSPFTYPPIIPLFHQLLLFIYSSDIPTHTHTPLAALPLCCLTINRRIIRKEKGKYNHKFPE